MKTSIHCLIVIGLLALAACSAPAAGSPTATSPAAPATRDQATSQEEAIALAERFFQIFVIEQDFAAATGDFDGAMHSALPEAKLKETWETLIQQVGAYQTRVGAPTVEQVDQYARVVIALTFENATLDMRVVVDTTTGLISGLFFSPSSAQPYEAPNYVDTEAFEEREVIVGSGEWQLPGVLTLPQGAGPFPAIVLVHGSGPNDRDETIGPNKPFKDLAWGLASRGSAVLRYDKRTKVYPDKLTALEGGLTVKEEVIDDAIAAVDLLRQTDSIDPERIFVLGHSLGGMLVPRIAQADPAIAGLISLAGPTRPLEELVLEQTRYILSLNGQPSVAEQQQLRAIEQQVEAIRALKPSDDIPADTVLLGAPPQYWLDLQGYDPAASGSALPRPMLILQGERDYQVTLVDFQRWTEALSDRDDVTLKAYPDLNHLFIAGTGQSTPDEYATSGHVAATVIEDIANWIDQQ
ncbi:MAG TPA: alpha/beta fold hydrolase [Anaerolineae bacterium]|nr:alpha/beta fold hydrolase [Anaerolineae bacterium]